MEATFAELTEHNQRLERAVTRLEELDRLKSNFLATMSHELRTPLTSVIGYAEMMVEGLAGPIALEQREYLKTILGKADQLLGLITARARRVERSSPGRSRSRPARSIARRGHAQRDRQLRGARDPARHHDRRRVAPRVVVGDRRKIRQIVSSLLSNAVKFTGDRGKVAITFRPADRRHVPDPDLHQAAGRWRGASSIAQRWSAPSASCASWPRSPIRSRASWNPIRCYDHMIAKDDVVYVPFAFGYVNYASRTDGRRLAFADVPTTRLRQARCSAAPASASARRSANREAAIAYARHLCSPQISADELCRGRRAARLARGLARRRGQRGDRRLLRRYAEDHPGLLSQADACGLPGLLPRLRAARRGRDRRRDFGRRAACPTSTVATASRWQRAGAAAGGSPDGRRSSNRWRARSRGAANTARRRPRRRSTSSNSWPTRRTG